MTRINCIPVQELSWRHLFAEFRELPRLRHLQPRQSTGNYKLGKGHVLFFLDKGLYLEKRHKQLFDELIRRKYDFITIIPVLELTWDKGYMNDWIPSDDEMEINRERIKERSSE